MRFLESVVSASCWLYSAAMILIGLGVIILSFINPPLQLQIALGIIGLGFVSLGLAQIKRVQNENRDEKRFEQIMAKLDEIQQELEKERQPERSGIAVADIISSSLKYYTEQMTKPKKEE
ncbi:hypothetical protein ACFLV5_02885 [Chloroflexota bacterium]